MIQNVLFFLNHKSEVKYLYDSVCIEEGLRLMQAHKFTAIPVIDTHGYYKGTVTEGDFLRFFLKHPNVSPEELKEHEVSSLIRKEYMPAMDINVDMRQVFARSLEQNFVPIVDDRNIFIGIVTRKSIISFLLEQAERHTTVSAADAMHFEQAGSSN